MSKQGNIGAELINSERIFSFIEGLRSIDKNVVIKQGLRKGAMVFIRAGRRRLLASPNGGKVSGNLMRSFTSRVKRMKLGALAGFKVEEGGYTAKWHDKGTMPRYTKRGAYRGIMPASYFWQYTKDASSGEAVDAVWKGIQQAMEQIRNRNNG